MHRPDLGHAANGACEVCGLNPGDFYITKTVTAPRAGKLTAQMYVEGMASGGGSASTSASMVIQAGGSSVSGSKSVGTTFTLFTSGSATVASGASITLKVGVSGAPSAGQCIVVDDIVGTLN